MNRDLDRSTRREILRRTMMGAAIPMVGGWIGGRRMVRADDAANGPKLLVRSSYPLDAETPVEVFDRFLTPNDLFFVRSHFGPPAVELLLPWKFEIEGLVQKPGISSIEDLTRRFKTHTTPAVLQCSGNGRGKFSPTIPGVAWDRGAVGNANWSGFRLVDLLEDAKIGEGAAHVHLHGADLSPHPKTPAYFRSIPIARALMESTLIATKMNDQPLPILHGGPMRLIVPGWAGNHWIKWLRKVTVSSVEAPGFYQQTAYKIPKVPVPPGTDPKPSDLVPVTALNVKSLIARPLDGATLPAGRVEIRGVAWTGEGIVERVEVQTHPDAPWIAANLIDPPRPGAWRTWKLAWDAPAGRHQLRARATDSQGVSQPELSPWNKSGYLWNAIDVISVAID